MGFHPYRGAFRTVVFLPARAKTCNRALRLLHVLGFRGLTGAWFVNEWRFSQFRFGFKTNSKNSVVHDFENVQQKEWTRFLC